jgi:hypothetical protein
MGARYPPLVPEANWRKLKMKNEDFESEEDYEPTEAQLLAMTPLAKAQKRTEYMVWKAKRNIED